MRIDWWEMAVTLQWPSRRQRIPCRARSDAAYVRPPALAAHVDIHAPMLASSGRRREDASIDLCLDRRGIYSDHSRT